MDLFTVIRQELARRVRVIRVDLFGDGDDGITGMARLLSLQPATWRNYEAAVVMPSEVLLLLIDRTNVAPIWLMTGEGGKYRPPDRFTGRIVRDD